MRSNLKGDLYERRRMVQGGLLVLLAVDLLFVFLIFRMGHEQQRGDLDQLNIEAKGRRETVARLKLIENNLGESSRLGSEFYQKKFLSLTTGFSTVMEEVDRLAVANGVRKGGVNYSLHEVRDHPDIQQVEIGTSLEGDYSKIVRFINQMEQSDLFLIVDSLAVGGGQGKSVHLTVKLLTYFRSPKGLE